MGVRDYLTEYFNMRSWSFCVEGAPHLVFPVSELEGAVMTGRVSFGLAWGQVRNVK